MMEPSNPLELVKNMRKKMQPLSLSKCGFFHHGTPSSGRTLASSWPTDFSLAEDMFASSLKGGKESKAQGQVRTVQTTDRRLLFVDQPHRPESHEGIVAAADHVCISRVTGACKQQLFKDQNPPPPLNPLSTATPIIAVVLKILPRQNGGNFTWAKPDQQPSHPVLLRLNWVGWILCSAPMRTSCS